MIKYITGNLFEKIHSNTSIKYIPHCCNNMTVMKSGFAKELTTRYPIVAQINKSTQLGDVEFIGIKLPQDTDFNEHYTTIVVNLIAQHQTIRQNEKPIRYEALVKCMRKLKDEIDRMHKTGFYECEIHAPMFGSGLAKGNWLFIEELIEEIWYDIPVYIYKIG